MQLDLSALNLGNPEKDDYTIEFDPQKQKMVVQFPESNQRYEYSKGQDKNESFRMVMKSPKSKQAKPSQIFRHVVPQPAKQPGTTKDDMEEDESEVFNEFPDKRQNQISRAMSPGGKLRKIKESQAMVGMFQSESGVNRSMLSS